MGASGGSVDVSTEVSRINVDVDIYEFSGFADRVGATRARLPGVTPIGAADMVREVGPAYPGGFQFITLDQWVMAKRHGEQKLSQKEILKSFFGNSGSCKLWPTLYLGAGLRTGPEI